MKKHENGPLTYLIPEHEENWKKDLTKLVNKEISLDRCLDLISGDVKEALHFQKKEYSKMTGIKIRHSKDKKGFILEIKRRFEDCFAEERFDYLSDVQMIERVRFFRKQLDQMFTPIKIKK